MIYSTSLSETENVMAESFGVIKRYMTGIKVNDSRRSILSADPTMSPDSIGPKVLRVCLIGPHRSGKTLYVSQLTGDMKVPEHHVYETTVGVKETIIRHKDHTVKLLEIEFPGIWDLGKSIGLPMSDGVLHFHDEDDNLTFGIHGVPVVHVYSGQDGEPLDELLALIQT